MEDLELESGKPGPIARLFGIFTKEADEEGDALPPTSRDYNPRPMYKSQVTVRRQILHFEEAYASAQGLKSGETQIVNLVGTEPGLRQKIVDFLSGVIFSQDGTMEEVGDHIFLLVPADVYVDSNPVPGGNRLGHRN